MPVGGRGYFRLQALEETISAGLVLLDLIGSRLSTRRLDIM